MKVLLFEFFIILLLLVFNGLFSMSETAVISARKTRLQQLAEEDNRRAQSALDLANTPNRFLATVQIGITLIGILTGVFGGATITSELAAALDQFPVIAPYSTAIAGAVVVLLLTYLSLVIGELVPKRVALNDPERVASLVAGPMTFLSRLAKPLVRVLGASTDLVLRVLRVRPSTEPIITAEEFMVIIEQGAEVGVFERSEQALIERILALDERRISSLMTPRSKIVALDISSTMDDVNRTLLDSQHSRFPVIDGHLDNVLGIVRAKDLLNQKLAGESIDLRGLLQPGLFLPETTTALETLEHFKQHGTHVGLVMDEFGGIQGMITHNDVLEAIVGYDPSQETPFEPQIVQRADGTWLVDGLTPIEEFEAALDLDDLHEASGRRYQTVGGLVMNQVASVPSAGQSFVWRNLRFEVVDMDGRRVDKVLVSPLV